MAALSLAATMDAIADLLVSEGVVARGYGWPAASVQPPAAIVGYPEEEIDFDMTFQRGSDRAVFPVWIVVGAVHDRTARDRLSVYVSGAQDVKSALEPDLGGAVQTVRVTGCQIEKIPIAAVEYVAARFDVEVFS